jgi:predicted phosphodiesterase
MIQQSAGKPLPKSPDSSVPESAISLPLSRINPEQECSMDQLTIFGDIHGNLPALTAVLDDMDRRQLTNRYCLGDLVGYGVSPNEVIDLIRSSGIPTIMGNYDQGVGNDSDDCGCAYTNPISKALGEQSIAWTSAHVDGERKTYLRELPAQLALQLANWRVLLVHGSPRRINEYLFEDRPISSIERILDNAQTDVLVCGHTHLPYHKVLPSGRHIINAGSVGKPKDGDARGCYVVLTAVGSDLQVEFTRVRYDVEQAASAIEATEMPHEYAQMIRLGQG